MRLKKRESTIKSQLFATAERRLLAMRPRPFYVLPIQQVRSSGTPDFTLNGRRRTTWWEIKHGTPHFDSPGIQEVTCGRLARTSYCRYIIYVETIMPWPTGDKHEQFVVIARPELIAGLHGKPDWSLVLNDADTVIPRFDHDAVFDYMMRVHEIMP